MRAPITENLDVGIKYRYFRADEASDFVNPAGVGETVKLHSHSVLATLTYNFGGATDVLPPAPPPPPAPLAPLPPAPVASHVAAPAAVCEKGPYIVFFNWNKSDITVEAASILDSAIRAYGSCRSVPIMLAGYADRSGTVKYNLGLSARRNAAVRAYLTTHGIADAAISSKAYGETNPRVPTADGVREPQNRRVEITYGPGSGY